MAIPCLYWLYARDKRVVHCYGCVNDKLRNEGVITYL